METKMEIRGGQFLTSEIEADMVFTPEDFSDEHHMIKQTGKQFIENEVYPKRETIEEQDFDTVVSLLRKAGELGLLAHSIPESYGGLGLDKMSNAVVGEMVGRAGTYGVAHSNQTCIATLPITYYGTKQQKQKYLPKLASGEYIGAYCLTEPGSGSDALAAKTTAVLNEQNTHYILNGTKLYITNAGFSDTFIVYAKVDGTKFTAFIVEKDFPGLSLGPEEKKMGIKGSSTRSVVLEDCLVPIENVLGEIGNGHLIALNVLNLGRFNLGAACMGGAKAALGLAIEHTTQRKQFNRLIADFGATKEKIAKMACKLYTAESLQYRSAGLLEGVLHDVYDIEDRSLVTKRLMEFAMECAICKVYGSEVLDYVVDESLQLHGGAGYIKEYPIEQAYRDSRINRIFEGTNEINRLLIPGTFFKKGAKGELPIQHAIESAVMELKQNDESREVEQLSEVRAVVSSIRRAFLTLAGFAYEQLGDQLTEHQEVTMKLADIAIELYASESTLLRTVKAIEKQGEEKADLKKQMMISSIQGSLQKVDALTKQLLYGFDVSQKRDGLLKFLATEFSCYSFSSATKRNRDIANFIIEAREYRCD
ncbi:acyl-CoA dehydrogenase family protein [Alkalihalobacterium bogoriense]|uniref:acyl-CoA dehydrogenase family protein n=1 Tax=Alkalihalobacterium bogoriense TaxID=246272 RepID=UPI0004786FAD|nr:acyl-CoA dehydrogenase family protein [Alkalihalobacterium bogoriense]